MAGKNYAKEMGIMSIWSTKKLGGSIRRVMSQGMKYKEIKGIRREKRMG